jgi:uncharacterized membrane protein
VLLAGVSVPNLQRRILDEQMRCYRFGTRCGRRRAPSLALAQKPVPAPSWSAEHCYGIAKAGSNDCASAGNNSCGGTSRVNNDPRAWIYVPTGYCERIVGGSKTPKA